jgi:DNA-binding response OmpR family regulator
MLILLVEDDPLCAFCASYELERANYGVLGPAVSSDEALQLVRCRRPDLALVDIDLERRGAGVDLVRALRAMNIPSVFMTAQTSIANEHAHLVFGHIDKPYDPADIPLSVDAVVSAMRGRGLPRSLPASLRVFSLAS